MEQIKSWMLAGVIHSCGSPRLAQLVNSAKRDALSSTRQGGDCANAEAAGVPMTAKIIEIRVIDIRAPSEQDRRRSPRSSTSAPNRCGTQYVEIILS